MLLLFADTRYRLFVNDGFVAYGPARFVTGHPEFDTHLLAPYLRAGENVLRVEVNYYGSSSFQTMPDGLPGFIAAGGTDDGEIGFATPGDWHARVHRAWDDQAPAFSFAQNPAEICDTRLLAQELALPAAAPVVLLPEDDTPWPVPVPRSVPCPDYAMVHPSRILVAGPIHDTCRWGIRVHQPGFSHIPEERSKLFVSYAAWIHSPREQAALMECFWTDIELNGEALRIEYPDRLGNHGEATVQLREGWNFLAGCIEVLSENWSFMIGFPRSVRASLHARPDHGCGECFAVSPPKAAPFTLACPAGKTGYSPPSGWELVASDLSSVTPARLVAWESPAAEGVIRNVPYAALPEAGGFTSLSTLWSFDFGDEYYGHPVVEVEAPAGSILDIAYDDWKRADGCVNLYNSNPFTDAADRFILRGGRQRIEVLNPRGGIYLQLVLRAPAGAESVEFTVREVAVRRRTTLTHCDGTFACGDPVLEWAWKTSVHTLMASTDEAYADCPWRERASYIGDSLVNFHLHRLVTADFSIARRTLRAFGLAQLPDGQLACCAPSWLRKPHEDFTLIWIQAIRDLWAHTGDTGFAASQWPVIKRIFASPTWKADADGLLDATGMRIFLDWGALPAEREGAGNTALNILRIAALRAASELATVFGFGEEADRFTQEARLVTQALLRLVWDEGEGRFHAAIGAETPAVHANILALRHGIGDTGRILAYLEPLLHDNLRRGIRQGGFSGFAELYFFYYLLPALALHGRCDLAEALIQEHYGYLQSLDCPTLPENFHAAHLGNGSCCHSWSGAPAIYATEYILGLRLAEPGNPDAYLLAPVTAGHTQAEGVLPHPKGLIRIRWERHGSRFVARVQAPEGVIITPAPNVEMTGTRHFISPQVRRAALPTSRAG